MGNICRSPAAENIFRHLVSREQADDVIEIDSAGTLDYHVGHKPDKRMSQTLRNRGIPAHGAARQFTARDFIDFDIILTMDDDNYHNVTKLDPDHTYHHKVRKFTSFCKKPDHQIPEVPDPYYGGSAGFELVADMLEDGCSELLTFVQKSLKNQG